MSAAQEAYRKALRESYIRGRRHVLELLGMMAADMPVIRALEFLVDCQADHVREFRAEFGEEPS